MDATGHPEGTNVDVNCLGISHSNNEMESSSVQIKIMDNLVYKVTFLREWSENTLRKIEYARESHRLAIDVPWCCERRWGVSWRSWLVKKQINGFKA